MAAADTLTTLDGLLKNVYLPGLTVWINRNRPIFQRLTQITDKKRFTGRQFIFAAKDLNPQGVGAVAEGGTLPAATASSIQNMTLAMKSHYAVISMSRQIMSQGTSDQGAFAEAVDLLVMGARDQLEEDLAISATYGAGFGELGQVKSGGGGTTLTMMAANTDVGGNGARFFRKNMSLDFFTATSGGTAHGTQTVSSVTPSANQIVINAAGSVANNDYAFRANSRGNVMMGLGGIVDDGTRLGTFQNLSRTTVPLLKANRLGNGGVLQAWTPELMDQAASEGWNNGGGAWPTAIYSRLEIQRRAAAYIRADRRADMATMELDNGYKAVAWTVPNQSGSQLPWFVDQFVRPNEVLFVREPDLFIAINEDIQWETTDGSMWIRDIGGRTHAFEAWLFSFRNMGARQCNNSTVLADVSHAL